MKTISIMVVGTPSITRDGYQALFAAIPELAALSPADDTQSAIAKLRVLKPDLVVLDSSVSEGDADHIVSAIRQSSRAAKCLVICPTAEQSREMHGRGAVVAAVEGIPPAELGAEVRRLAMHVQLET